MREENETLAWKMLDIFCATFDECLADYELSVSIKNDNYGADPELICQNQKYVSARTLEDLSSGVKSLAQSVFAEIKKDEAERVEFCALSNNIPGGEICCVRKKGIAIRLVCSWDMALKEKTFTVDAVYRAYRKRIPTLNVCHTITSAVETVGDILCDECPSLRASDSVWHANHLTVVRNELLDTLVDFFGK